MGFGDYVIECLDPQCLGHILSMGTPERGRCYGCRKEWAWAEYKEATKDEVDLPPFCRGCGLRLYQVLAVTPLVGSFEFQCPDCHTPVIPE